MRALLQRLFSSKPQRAPSVPRTASVRTEAPVATNPLWPVTDLPLDGTRPSTSEQYAITVVRSRVTAEACPSALIGRAPTVIPRLMAMLRQDHVSAAAMAEQVTQDATLAAAVLRLSQSPLYRIRRQVNDIETAIAVLGIQGLRAAIATVIMKPIFHERPWGLLGAASTRLWAHGELQATIAGSRAAALGADQLDGYLAGLLHNLGWAAALRSLDLVRAPLNPPFTEGFAQAMVHARARLFGRLAVAWDITPGLTEVGRELLQRGAETEPDTLLQVLREADAAATRDMFPFNEGAETEPTLV